jgi:large subunit ribosomal protein L18
MLKKGLKRLRRKNKIRSKISWTAIRPRLSVFRSNTNISVQIIDDLTWKTLWSASSIKFNRKETKLEESKKVWTEIAEIAKKIKIKEVLFDRWGFAYHGRVKALADAAREGWLKF